MTKQETIGEITRRLVEFYRPVRVYLFGSEARGESGTDSDLDFCVVLPDDAPESLYRDRSIHGHFRGLRSGRRCGSIALRRFRCARGARCCIAAGHHRARREAAL